MMNELSIVVPCISTIEPVPKFIDELAQYLIENPSDVDLVIVANAPIDASEKIVEYAHQKYPWLKLAMLQRTGGGRSYGALARFGIAYSTSRYVVLVSPYGEDDLSILPTMLRKIRQGAQVVQATRYATATDAQKVAPLYRTYQTVYRILTKLLLGVTITDSTYGFKMFDRVFIQALGLHHNGHSISPEITLKAVLANGKVEYISSSAKPRPVTTDFKLRNEGVRYIWLLVRGWSHRQGILWF